MLASVAGRLIGVAHLIAVAHSDRPQLLMLVTVLICCIIGRLPLACDAVWTQNSRLYVKVERAPPPPQNTVLLLSARTVLSGFQAKIFMSIFSMPYRTVNTRHGYKKTIQLMVCKEVMPVFFTRDSFTTYKST